MVNIQRINNATCRDNEIQLQKKYKSVLDLRKKCHSKGLSTDETCKMLEEQYKSIIKRSGQMRQNDKQKK